MTALWSVTCHMGAQCYLPPDTGERAPPLHQPRRPVLDLSTPEGWKAEFVDLVTGSAAAGSRTRDLSVPNPML